MFRRPKKFEATPQKPFDNDKLGRDKSIIHLTKLMEDTHTPLVMTVSAPWGSGKSSFVKMWKAYLESEREDTGRTHPCIMFNAWKHDFHKEPLLAVMGEIGAFIAENSVGKKGEEALKKAMKVLPKLFKASAGMAYAASFFVPGMGAVKEILDKSADAVKKVDDYVFEEHSSQKKRLEIFKAELEKFVQIVTNNGANGPLYFFVDELDRCDPEYAIKLLESVKHFFDVKGIVFVLSVDRDKLGSMVRVRYGENYDADGYLKRFVDVDYQIQEPEREKLISYLCEDVLELNQYPIGKTKERLSDVKKTALILANDYNMAARDIEKVFLKLSPHLRGDFSEIESEIFIQRGSEFFWNRGDASVPISAGVLSKLQNYFYPLLILAFVKEVAPAHYARYGEVYAGSSSTTKGQLRELRESRPQSLYGQNVISELQKKPSPSDLIGMGDGYRIRFRGDMVLVDLLFASCLLSLSEGYWEKKEVEIRSNLDSLDNITFLSAEESTDDSDAA